MHYALSWALTHPGIVLAAAIFTTLAWISWAPWAKWQLRTVPGSWGWPLAGNLPSFAPHTDIGVWVDQQCRKYPVAFQMWLGAKHYVVVSSPEMGRRLLLRYRARPNMDDLTSYPGEDHKIWNSGLLYLTGAKWRVVRKAFEAALMNPTNLAAQAPNVARCAERLCTQLQRCAESGEPTDVLPLVYTMTLDAVGFAAFGVDLEATKSCQEQEQAQAGAGAARVPWWEQHPLGSSAWSQSFVGCAVGVMRSMNFAEHSIYQTLPIFFPALATLLRKLSEWLPDAKLVQHSQNFEGLRQGCKAIIQLWREKQAGGGKASLVSDNGFMARLLKVVEQQGTEVQLSDVDVVGNAIFMVAAGYETTGSAISSTLFLLSHNLDAQQRLQAELDTVLNGREVTPDDVDKLPYLQAVFQESLRIHSPAVAAVREVSDSHMDLGQGVRVPKGTSLWFPLSFYFNDPHIWPRPAEFLPERYLPTPDGQPSSLNLTPGANTAAMPFGHGSRMCVGYKFALLEAHLGLARILQRFSFQPVPGTPHPKWNTSLATSPDKIVLSVLKR